MAAEKAPDKATDAKGYDLAVIGAGPGGYVAAIRAAQLGMKVAVVEKAELGGICTNWGCIPTKALLRSVEILELMRHAADFGLKVEGASFDWQAVIKRSRAVADKQARGVAYLFKKNKIDHIAGTAKLAKPNKLLVDGKELPAKHVIVATGARPKTFPPALVHDGDRVISYREAMFLAEQPKSLVIIGAGAIGIEFAYFYSVLGTRVHVVEALPQILPVEDEEVSQELTRRLRARKDFDIHVDTKVEKLDKSKDKVKVSIAGKAGSQVLEAERALLAVGVVGNVEGIGLEDVGVKVERGFIAVDRKTYRTNIEGIYAIGDVIGAPMLAHKASAEGIACVERIAGSPHAKEVNYGAIPGCTYCKPEVASVGMTEKQARAAGREIKVGKFPLRVSGKAAAVGETEGFVKVIVDAKYGEILGAHLLGGDATDLIAELTLARSAELTTDEILATVHAHPTFAESVKEAVAAALGEAIDI